MCLLLLLPLQSLLQQLLLLLLLLLVVVRVLLHVAGLLLLFELVGLVADQQTVCVAWQWAGSLQLLLRGRLLLDASCELGPASPG
jgi:hypothetical protein